MMQNKKIMSLGMVASVAFAVAFAVMPVLAGASGYTEISGNTTLQVGSKGVNVTALQQLLSSNSDMYPSGTQDGSFGPNTKAGVVQFQLAYNLSADGLVGPNTRSVMNNVVLAGKGIDVSNAGLYNLSIVSSGRNEVISFTNNEPVKAVVFYDTNAINWNNWDDAAMTLNTPNISGMNSLDNTFSVNKQFTLTNLSPNTTYNYTITTTDQAGNTSVITPTTFRTAQ